MRLQATSTSPPASDLLALAVKGPRWLDCVELGSVRETVSSRLRQMRFSGEELDPYAVLIVPILAVGRDGYLAADGIELSDEVLDRIDEIVPPAATINVADNMWQHSTAALSAAARRQARH